MDATIDVRLTISIDDDKTIPLATLAELLTDLGSRVTDQNVESVLLEELVERFDACRVKALCAPMETVSNDSNGPAAIRTAVTTADEYEFALHYVEDTATDRDESSYSRPVEAEDVFDGQNRYQQDIAATLLWRRLLVSDVRTDPSRSNHQ